MPALASNRLAKHLQRKVAEHAFWDTGNLLHDSVSSLDEYGQPVVSTSSTAVMCSFMDSPDLERWKDYTDISQVGAEVRFASATPVSGDRFTVTGRFDDSTYTDKTFEIIGIKNRGAFGYVCALKQVST